MLISMFLTFVSQSILGHAAIYEPSVLWDKNELKVCFYDQKKQILWTEYGNDKNSIARQGFTPATFSDNEKYEIFISLTKNYTKEKTGIFFSGWKNCSEETNADVIVIKGGKIKRTLWFGKGPSFGGRATIGQNGVDKGNGFAKNESTKMASVVLNDINPYVINHEFGHITGLRHEHVHPNKTATNTDNQSCSFYFLKEDLKSAVLLDYDNDSIMNYCRYSLDGRNLDKRGYLSTEDQNTLRSLYAN